MTVIKSTYSLSLTQDGDVYTLTRHGEVVVMGNDLDNMLKEYDRLYRLEYCVDMY